MAALNPDLVREVDKYIDAHHGQFSELGRKLFDVFGFDAKKDRIATQVRNLQQVACSATRFADIEDFVKNQMGKTGNAKWRQIGDTILSELNRLRIDSNSMASNECEAMAVRLRLARGWVRAVVSEYLYQVAQAQMGVET